MAPPTTAEILKDTQVRLDLIDRIAFRKQEQSVEIVPPNPEWPNIFEGIKQRIVDALGDKALEVHHTGSTSIPDLPAKDVIDVDLVVPDINDEGAYAEQLKAAGFSFLLREPHWHSKRFFCTEVAPIANVHVWGPECPEVLRHRIFREHLLRCPEDLEKYRKIKELSARQVRNAGGSMVDYNLRKEETIRQILRRAFKELGYLE